MVLMIAPDGITYDVDEEEVEKRMEQDWYLYEPSDGKKKQLINGQNIEKRRENGIIFPKDFEVTVKNVKTGEVFTFKGQRCFKEQDFWNRMNPFKDKVKESLICDETEQIEVSKNGTKRNDENDVLIPAKFKIVSEEECAEKDIYRCPKCGIEDTLPIIDEPYMCPYCEIKMRRYKK